LPLFPTAGKMPAGRKAGTASPQSDNPVKIDEHAGVAVRAQSSRAHARDLGYGLTARL
jgi:hypothetical protein